MEDHAREIELVLAEIKANGWAEIRGLQYHLVQLSWGAGIGDALLDRLLEALEHVAERPMRSRVLIQPLIDVLPRLTSAQHARIRDVLTSNPALAHLDAAAEVRRIIKQNTTAAE